MGNPPKNIGEIVRGALEAARPAQDQRADSWLGRWKDVGWSIRITPRLSSEEWDRFTRRSSETWDRNLHRHDAVKSLSLLGELFPRHALSLTWPKCGKRTRHERVGQPPLYAVCEAVAKHTVTHLRDVNGTKVSIARCDEHRGQL